jgi:hypothetical protein
MKKRFLNILCSLLVLLFLCGGLTSNAQTQPFEQTQVFQQEQINAQLDGNPGDPYCDPLCNCRKDGTICPIDNGLVALLAAGAVFGIVQIRRSKAALR